MVLSGDNLLLKLDEALTTLLGEWDTYSTLMATVLFIIVIIPLFTTRDPDAHPMLLARQAQASPVRNDGESAVYRSHSSPHGMELNTGLNVKDAGMSKWAKGRDGDLRDVWRKVVNGPLAQDGTATGQKGRIMTVLGTQNIVEHEYGNLNRG